MKKIYSLLLIATLLFIGTGSYAADEAQTAKVDSTLQDISTGAGLVHATLDATQVDFGGATELKDSVLKVFETLSTDSEAQKIKTEALDLIELGEKAKAEQGSWWNSKTILGILGLVLLLVGWVSRHFGVFYRKS